MKNILEKSCFSIGILGFVGAIVGVMSFAENSSWLSAAMVLVGALLTLWGGAFGEDL